MADKQAEIKALQAIVTGLSAQSFGHRIQGLVFGSKGLGALADKYAAHADLQETNQDLDLINLIGLQNWLVLKPRHGTLCRGFVRGGTCAVHISRCGYNKCA